MDRPPPHPSLEELRKPLARWELGLLPPEAVPDLAAAAMQRGCTLPELAILAGLRDPLRADVDDQLRKLLKGVRWSRPTHEQAVKTVADDLAAQIVERSITAPDGAHQLWQLANIAGFGGPIWTQLSFFVGLASEWDDHPEHRATLEATIVRRARELLAAGGIQPEP